MNFNDFIANQFKLNGHRIKPETKRNLQWAIGKLNEFGSYDCSEINSDWLNQFDNFLIEQDLNHNSVVNIHQKIRTYVQKAILHGFMEKDPYANFKSAIIAPVTIYLTEDELDAIYELKDLPKHLDVVRDAFLITAYTGLRKSDVSPISRKNLARRKIDGEWHNFLQVVITKTQEKIFIPIHPRVLEILEKHKWDFAPGLHHCNQFIKKVGELAGIDDDIIINQKKGQSFKVITKKKYELMQFHTGRRTAATNMYKMGIDRIAIMKITGHKKEATFMKYIRITNEENAINLSTHEYFKGRTKEV